MGTFFFSEDLLSSNCSTVEYKFFIMITEVTEAIVKTEHQLRAGNDLLVDEKELTTRMSPNGEEITILVHSRKINDNKYVVKTTMRNKDGNTIESVKMTKLSDAQATKFLDEWNRKWANRTITDSEVKTATDEAVKQAKKAKVQNKQLETEEPNN